MALNCQEAFNTELSVLNAIKENTGSISVKLSSILQVLNDKLLNGGGVGDDDATKEAAEKAEREMERLDREEMKKDLKDVLKCLESLCKSINGNSPIGGE